jgi:hypothetical protein
VVESDPDSGNSGTAYDHFLRTVSADVEDATIPAALSC